MSNNANSNFFPALTGVRAFAAITVFITHAGYIIAGGAPAGVQRYFNELSIGLPMFFVLTGFLITIRYYDAFKFDTNWINKFMISRAARLYPMYFFFTTASFIYYYVTHTPSLIGDPKHPWFVVFLNYTFLRSFFDDLKFTGVGQGWSITVDVVFYMITPFVFYLIKQKKILWLQLTVFVPIGLLLVYVFRGLNFYGFFGNVTFMLYYTFFGRSIEIFMGIFLALNFQRLKLNPGNKIKLTYIGFVLMFVCVYFFSIIPLPAGQPFGIKTNMGMVLDTVLLSPAIVVFFWGLISEQTFLQRALSTKFMQLLGNSAFMFYLIHLGFIKNILSQRINDLNDWIFEVYDKIGVDWYSPLQFDQLNVFFEFALLYVVSVFLYKFMEEPLNKHLRNFLFKKYIKFDKPRDGGAGFQTLNDLAGVKTRGL